ncbi:hypothetical protein OR1_02868 [Geobacter sp. OR-1]|uniref:DUF1574 family protein n=1 Tax=Geobacter sp. OR-1 TaxID=1266765 RepID=UPI0005430D8B|nr:DUF1574 family protein [Geobacter sp. OR-1]GAM10579.1 hypothetical protein OR1_02868 [Geobacter sp. OR-1]
MRALIALLASFLLGICFWLGVRVYLLDYVHMPERAMWLAKAKMIEDFRYRQGDIIIIGSSRAMAISPELLKSKYNQNAINFSVGGATTPSTYFFLKRILKKNPDINKLYLEFAPINMTRKDTALDASLGENFLRYVATEEEAMELDEDMPGALKRFRKIHKFPYTEYFNMKDTSLLEGVVIRWRTGKSDSQFISTMEKGAGYFLYPQIFSLSDKQKEIFDKKAREGYEKQLKLTKDLPPVTELYFSKIISLLKKKNIRYTIFFSPVYEIGLNYDKLAFGDTYQLFAHEKNNISTNIPVFERELFSEPSHVNAKGSEEYTEVFYKYVFRNEVYNHTSIDLFNNM